MQRKDYRGARCEKRQFSKCEGICKTYNDIQSMYAHLLNERKDIEPDFQERGAHDYRKDACLTMRDFEKVVLYSLNYYMMAPLIL